MKQQKNLFVNPDGTLYEPASMPRALHGAIQALSCTLPDSFTRRKSAASVGTVRHGATTLLEECFKPAPTYTMAQRMMMMRVYTRALVSSIRREAGAKLVGDPMPHHRYELIHAGRDVAQRMSNRDLQEFLSMMDDQLVEIEERLNIICGDRQMVFTHMAQAVQSILSKKGLQCDAFHGEVLHVADGPLRTNVDFVAATHHAVVIHPHGGLEQTVMAPAYETIAPGPVLGPFGVNEHVIINIARYGCGSHIAAQGYQNFLYQIDGNLVPNIRFESRFDETDSYLEEIIIPDARGGMRTKIGFYPNGKPCSRTKIDGANRPVGKQQIFQQNDVCEPPPPTFSWRQWHANLLDHFSGLLPHRLDTTHNRTLPS